MNTPITPEQIVNSYRLGNQSGPSAATLTDGSYVLIWSSAGQDGSSLAVVGQRFSALGERLGPEFIVNSTFVDSQGDAEIAATADGGFVVTWAARNQDNPGDNDFGIFAQRFDAQGDKAGGEFQVNDTVTRTQNDPDVAGLPGGGFVITWYDDDGDGAFAFQRDVRAQIFDASGAEVGTEFTVNTTGAGTSSVEDQPVISAIQPSGGANGLAGGGFVIAWQEASSTIRAQRYDQSGTALGAEFAVSTISASESEPVVADLSGGRFVVVWTDSSATDGSAQGVFARVFEGDGMAVGSDFQVNVQTSSTQWQPAVIGTDDGGFVVAWASWFAAGDGDRYGVIGRKFDADGVALTGEAVINAEIQGNQDRPALAALANGAYVAAWQSDSIGTAGDGDGFAVAQRLMGDPLTFPAIPASPEVEAVSTSRVFGEAAVNAAPQRLDADGAVAVSDFDSADFDGGRLTLALLAQSVADDGYLPQDAEGQDVLGFDTSGAVSVSGSMLSVDGTSVGTIVQDGTGGAPLVVDLSAGATPGAVEILIENLTYGNLSDDPRAETRLQLLLEDGDGAASTPVVIDVAITPEQDIDGFLRGETRVNTFTTGDQENSAVAPLAGGGYVAVWESVSQDGSGEGVYAQRYDANGLRSGDEFRVNETTSANQYQPRIAGLTDGGWVIVWRDDNDTSVRLNRYDALGARIVTEEQVETTTIGTQFQPGVAGLSNGGYAVVWTSTNGDGSSNGVFTQLFNASGARVGPETAVNQQTTGDQSAVRVTELDSGRYLITWNDRDPAGDGSAGSIAARLFAANGAPEAPEFTVNTTTAGDQFAAHAVQLAGGDIIVAWLSNGQDGSQGGVYYQRLTDQGVAVGGEVRVNASTVGDQRMQDLIALDGGGFAIAWVDTTTPAPGNGSDIFTQVFDADGTRLDSETRINTEVSGTQDQARLVPLADDNFVVQWTSGTSSTAGDGSGDGVFYQVVGDPGEISVSQAPSIAGLGATVTLTESAAGAGVSPFGQATQLDDPDSPDFDGGSLSIQRIQADENADDYNAPDDNTQDNLTVVAGGAVTLGLGGTRVIVGGVDVADIVSDGTDGSALELALLPGATPARMETLLAAITYQNASDDPAASRTYSITLRDGDGGVSDNRTLEIAVTPEPDLTGLEKVGGETQVNSYTQGNQFLPAVAVLNDGGWVTVWESEGQDGSGDGIFGQRYDADGNRLGGEFQVATTTSGGQSAPSVAGLSNGGWAVVWQGTGTGDTNGVFVQRYGSDGLPDGTETLVNARGDGVLESQPVVAGLATSHVVIYTVGSSVDGSSNGVFFQRFDTATGAALGGETQVNTIFSSSQDSADVAVLNDGRFVIVWKSDTGDGSSSGVYASVFNANGSVDVAEFLVNTETLSNQNNPAVGATADGGFVVAWEDSSGQDGSGTGIAAQRYDSTATAQGGEFVVNDTRNSTQQQPDVIGLDDGRFVVTWTDSFNGLDGSGAGVFGQAYTATGERIDGEFLVNTSTQSAQDGANGTALPGGAFVTAWRSFANNDTDPDGYGVFQQIFGDPASFSPGGAPTISGLSTDATFAEADVNAALQRLDADSTVALADSDSVNFDGGSLSLSVADRVSNIDQFAAPDGPTQDRLGLLAGDVGNGDVQVTGLGVGDTVSVDGTVIGTIASDGTAGQPFRIDFGAGATVEAVEALLGNLAYSNDSDAPAPARQLKLDLTDDTGRAIPSQFIDVTVTPDPDTTLIGQDERGVNAHTEEDQQAPRIVELTGGGFVVVWQSDNQDNRGIDASQGIFGQLYESAGVPAGPEFRVNTTLANAQGDPGVAATADGGFVVVWESQNQDNPGDFDFGIVAQRFNSDGSLNGGEIVINQAVQFTQFDPAVAAFADGGFVVSFTSDTADASADGIVTRFFDAAGVGAAEQTVNVDNISGNQGQSDVATLVDGGGANAGHVVVFTAPSSGTDGDGSFNGVYARIYNPAPSGTALGAEFLVNTTTDGSQSDAAVTGLTGGGFVVVWTDDRNDGSSNGVFGQIYDNSGGTVGAEFRVNTNTSSSQSDPSVTAMDDGGFVVSWSDNSGRDGSGVGVFGQRFDASGARIDGEFQINEEFSSTQDSSDVTAFGTGFAAVWRSETSDTAGDGDRSGISLRTFEEAPAPDTSPNVSDVARTVTLFADDVTTGDRILDDAIAVDDPDSSQFAGATLDLYYTTPATATDQLSIAATGPITVAGSQISHDGTVVATIDATNDGADGAALTITFNANTNLLIFQDIAERVAFASTDLAANVANTERGVGFYFTDSTGRQTEPDSVFVEIDPGAAAPTGLAIGDWGLSENEQVRRLGPVSEAGLIAAPLVIDGDVDFDDFAGTSFDGGFVLLDESGGSATAQQLSVQDQGAGTARIGFNGTIVGYEGTDIGTVDATENGADGANLRINLNAAATAEGIEALIEAFTFGLSGATTDYTPDLRVSVGNMAGNTSNVAQLRFDIDRDAVVVGAATGEDIQVNTFTFDEQQSPRIAALSDGGYVITWTSRSQDAPESSQRGIFAQLYSETGAQVGVEFQVNDIALNDQVQPRATGLPNGNFVILWTETSARDGSGQGVFGQLLQNDGTALGTAFQVNEETSSTQNSGQVIAVDGGRFMTVWTSQNSGNAGDGSGTGIFARVFDATATPEGGEFQVNTSTLSDQARPRAVTLPDGDVMVVWEDRSGADGNAVGVFAQRIDPAGNLVGFGGTGIGADERQINTTTASNQDRPDVAALEASGTLPNGGFVFVWESPDSSSDGIFAQIYDIAGNAVGGEFRVNTAESSSQSDPVVIGRDGGGFAVIWSDDSGIDGSGRGVVAQEFLADGTPDGLSFVVNSAFSSTQDQPELAELDNGTLVAAWRAFTSADSGDGSNYGVFQKLFDAPPLAPGAMSPVLEGLDDAAEFDESAVNAGLQLIDADGLLSLTDVDSSDFDGGRVTVSQIVGSGQVFDDQLGPDTSQIGLLPGGGVTVAGAVVSVGGTAIGTVDATNDGQGGAPLVIALNADATPERVETVLARLAFADTSDDPQADRSYAVNVTDGDGGATGNQVFTVSVTPETDRTALPRGEERQVNSYVPGNQSDAASAPVYDGSGAQVGYVTVWSSADQDRPQDGGAGIFGQVFDLDGAPVGGEFRVTEHTEFNQTDPAVAGLTGGGFVVGWSDDSDAHPAGLPVGETTTGVFGRVFDQTGGAVTGDFLINDVTPSTQNELDLATKADGGFLASFTDHGSRDGSSLGVFVREFDGIGTAAGAAIQANTETSGQQRDSTVAELAGGRFAVVWTSQDSGTAGDGSGAGVFARVFEAGGTPVGSEIPVNTYTDSTQSGARVAALDGGDFVVVWQSSGQDGSSTGVFQQRFDAGGAPVGAEVRVNSVTSGNQDDPYIVALDTGGWVVAWGGNGTGDGQGVYGQEFATDGSRVDDAFQINTETASTQFQPRLVALPGGGFAASWSSFTSGSAGDGSNYGVFQQLYGDPGSVAISPDPILTNLSDLAVGEAEVNGAGVQLAGNAGVGDDTPADLDGAVLTVSHIYNDRIQEQFAAPDDATQDQLSLAAVGGVSLSGSTVSVDGTAVGTVGPDGADGADLAVAFNAAATAADVEAVLQAVTYTNTSDDPEAVRQVAVQFSDGDGGWTREIVEIAIAPEADGGVPVDGEVQTNSFTTDNQSDSHIAGLADGGYVIVWTSRNQDATGDGQNGVFAQRYDDSGAPVGGEVQVNTTTASSQQNAQVVGLATGGFAVAWEDLSGQTGDDNDQEVVIQVFDALGTKIGGEIAVDSPNNDNPIRPALAAFDNGNFAIVYDARDVNNAFQRQVYGQRFDDQGGQVGVEFQIPVPPADIPEDADVAVQSDGTFAVAFVDRNIDNPGDNDFGVFLQRFDATGGAVGGPVQVNTLERFSQYDPRVAATEDGGYVVVYTSDIRDDFGFSTGAGIYAQRFDATGNRVGDEFLVNRIVDGSQFQPDVAPITGTGGGFAVTYSDSNNTDGSGTGVFLQQYDAQARRIDGPVQVNEATSSTQDQGAIAALPGGNLVVSFSSNNSAPAGDGDQDGVFHRIVGDPADFASGGDPVLDGINASVTYAEDTLNGVPQLIDANGAAAVSDPDSADFDGGSILVSNVIASAPLIDQINAPDDLTQDQLGLRTGARITQSGTTVSVDGTPVGTIAQDGQDGTAFELALNANATAEIVELLVENLTYRNISDDPLETRLLRVQITDGDGGASDPALVNVSITPTPDGALPVGGERAVNTTDTGNEDNPAVAQLPGTGGDFVVVFESFGTDGDREGILGQRFDVNGNPVARDGSGLASGVTDEFAVNTTSTINDQYDPDIAGFSDGSWIVVWADDTIDGSSTGITAQRFNADGTLDGTEFQVNSEGSSQQDKPAVAVLDDDSFVVTWRAFNSGGSGDGNGYGITARHFDGSGTTTDFVVNTTTSGSQDDPSITRLNDGGFLVTWTDPAADGSSNGVYAQRFDSTAAAVGGEFRVNTTTANSQADSEVTVLGNGNLVVVWTDNAADLSSNGVFAQIYAPDGTPVTEEFRVNDQRINSQDNPSIAPLDTGGFVIAWTDNSSTDGNGDGVFAQQYNAAGNRIDTQFQVNTTTSGAQNQPDVAALDGGGFVVAFNGSVLIQVYGNQAPTVSPVSATGDEDSAIALDAAIFDAGFVDPDGNSLQAVRIDTFPTNGSLTLSGSPVTAGQTIARADLLAGNLVYTGNQDYNGSDSFLWTGSDGIAFASGAVSADITVLPVNDAPGLEAGADTTIGEGQTVNRQLQLTDPDVDTRSFTVDYGDGSPLATFNSSSLTPSISHVYGSEGVFTVTVTVDDNSGAPNAVEIDTFTVTVENAPPVTGSDNFAVSEDGPAFAGDVLANDSDPGGDPIQVSAVNGAPGDVGAALTLGSGALLTIDATGTFSYDPNGQFEALADFQFGSDSFSYTVSDGLLETTRTVNVTIDGQNDDPVAVDDDATVNDDSTVTFNILANDTDIDGNTLSVQGFDGAVSNVTTLGNGDLQGTVTASGAIVTLDPVTGDLTYDPNGAFAGGGADSFGYVVTDNRGGTESATVSISVQGTNQTPTAADDLFVIAEDVDIVGGDIVGAAAPGPDSDADGDPLTVVQVNGSPGDVGVPLTLASGATLTVSAGGGVDFAQNGVYGALAVTEQATETFTYTISDGQGGSDSATVTVRIDGVNDAPSAGNVSDTALEDGAAVSGDLLAASTDPDTSDTLSILEINGSTLAVGSPVTLASGAILTVQSDGSYSYDPATGFQSLRAGITATDTAGFTVSDGNGGTDTATLFVEVTGVNDAPEATDDAFATPEDTALTTANLLDNDNDPDDADLPQISAVNGQAGNVGSQIVLASGALLTVNGSGSFSFDPDGQFDSLQTGDVATETFTYTIADGQNATDTATVTITVNGISAQPVALDDTGTTDEDTPTILSPLLNDSDADGDSLNITQVAGQAVVAGGTVTLASGALATLNADGTIGYDPNGQFDALDPGDTGGDSFTYQVDDGTGGTATATVTVTIGGLNDAPVAAPDARTTDEDSAITFDLLANNGFGADSDPDDDAVLVTGTIDGQAIGVGDSITLSSGAIVTRTGAGDITYDPNGQFETLGASDGTTDSFGYVLSDGNGGSDTATVTITIDGVNDAPDAVDDARSVQVGAVLTGDVLANDTDPDASDTLGVIDVQSGGTLGTAVATNNGGLVTLNANGTFQYDQNGAFAGLPSGQTATDSFSYTISDGNGGTDTATVTITIGGTNQPPVAVDDSYAVDDGEVLTVAAGAGLLANDTDADGDGLTVQSIEAPANGVINIATDGSFEYTPDVGFVGQEVLTYTVSDGAETATGEVTIDVTNTPPVAVDDSYAVDDGEVLTVAAGAGLLANDTDADGDGLTVQSIEAPANGVINIATDGSFEYTPDVGFVGQEVLTYTVSDGAETATGEVTIDVTNTPPVAVDDSYAVDDGEVLTVAAGAGLLANDTDADGDALTVQSIEAPANGVINIATDGSFEYTPDVGFVGQEVLTYTVSDGAGTATGEVTITVTPSGTPAPVDDSYTMRPNGTLAIAAPGLLANDTDPDGDTLTVVGFNQPSNGTVAPSNDGSFTYTPNVGFIGTDSFLYTVSDGTNTASATATVEVLNTAPTVVDETYMTAFNTALSIAAPGLLFNDTDDDGDPLEIVGFGSAANGTVAPSFDGSFTYTPDPAFSGTDSFTYAVSDGFEVSQGTATVTVTPNTPPVAVDDGSATFTTDEDTAFTTGNVLDNDSDPDGHGLSVAGFDTTGTLGLVIDNGDGTFAYDPNGAFESLGAGDSATDSFLYTVSDGNGGTATATVSVTIDGVNDAPVAADDGVIAVTEDTPLEIDVLANDSDAEDGTPTIDSFTQGANGTVSQTAGGLTYAPDLDFTGTDSFAYTVIDSEGATATATVSVNVGRDTDGDGCPNIIDGDFDQDGFVGASDAMIFAAAFGSALGAASYNPDVDMDGDDFIGASDAALFASVFGQFIDDIC